jgi:hypothetical protein
MSQKLSFAERAEKLAEAADALRCVGQDLAWIADAVGIEAEAMAAARERFATQRGRQSARAAK